MTINFDMDGTIADLYSFNGWLDCLLAFDPTPYVEAKPLLNLSVLARQLNKLQKAGYTLRVISWLSKNSCEEYDKAVTTAKMTWLKKHLPSVHWDEICIVAYGTPKSSCGDGILFDDELKNRLEWQGIAFDQTHILETLKTF